MVRIVILAFWIAGIVAAQPADQGRMQAIINAQQNVGRVRTTETIVARFTRTNTPMAIPTRLRGTATTTPTFTETPTETPVDASETPTEIPTP